MNQKLPYFLFLFLCFSLNTFLNAQPQNDSLAKYSYEELGKEILKYKTSDISKRDLLIKEYVTRAKLTRDTLKLAEGYFLSAVYSNDSLALKYSDSIIDITKNIKGHKKFPAMGYYFKGYCLYTFGKNQKSLNNFLTALEFLSQKENIRLEIDVRIAVITLVNNWKGSEEILKYNEELVSFLHSLLLKNVRYKNRYFNALGNLSLTYIGVGQYKKSLSNTRKGILETINTQDTIKYYDFVSNAGIAKYYLKDYQPAIDSLKKGLPYEDGHGKAMGNYYLAKSYNKLNQPEKAQFHFLKTDSIYQVSKDIFPEMRNAYEHIIDYYKSKNDTENQIKYYDRLIETDKIIDSTYTYVTNTVEKKYETPQAIAERNRLLEEAQEKENAWKYSFGIISAILLLISGVLFYAFRRQKYYKQRFENLMSKNSEKPKDISTALNVTSGNLEENTSTVLHKTSEKQKQQGSDIGISETIVKSILKGLSKFEASEGYRKQVTLTELAKTLETNPKYLSKVINWHYEKNFSSYVNELRVEYVVSKLKSDSKFRNYTIKAIAKEAGFGGAESFSKTFYKTTGIYPSYFIKQLNKRQNS